MTFISFFIFVLVESGSYPLSSSLFFIRCRMDPKAVEHIREVIHDKNRIWNQFIAMGSNLVGMELEQFTMTVVGVFAIYIALGENARTAANFILIAAPLFVYAFAPEEKPKQELMIIYCASYVLTTAMDLSLQSALPAYYVLKVIFHLCLFLRPYCLAEKILEYAEQGNKEKKEEKNEDETVHKLFSKEELKTLLDRKAKSPPPEKPEGEKPTNKTESTNTGSPWPQSTEMRSVPVESPPEQLRTAVPPSVAHQVFDQPKRGFQPGGLNPMQDSPSSYALITTSSATNTPTAGTPGEGSISERGVGPYDIKFEPKDCVVFNAPFDYAHLTYHVRMTNLSRFKIGYAIKSNAIPRVTAVPPTGIIKPLKTTNIAITVQKMDDFKENDFPKDRLAFEYVRVPDETEKFEFKHIQKSPIKLRKNIRIKYNA